ncbi:translation elongation factor P Lys34:lysine transferase [Vibrio maritimus]|uniref:Translation elongation factor P Lys34:lysine transferase n=1 Tax=Vibrio maritimus TaxID=990268 RepID=A0A090TBE5_9VIBR|nr:translation elongation factor P Lys34:lysine transferase [Vibrio maritimus]
MITNQWQPTASIALLKKRAELIQSIRSFFMTREVMEVDTPAMSHAR